MKQIGPSWMKASRMKTSGLRMCKQGYMRGLPIPGSMSLTAIRLPILIELKQWCEKKWVSMTGNDGHLYESTQTELPINLLLNE